MLRPWVVKQHKYITYEPAIKALTSRHTPTNRSGGGQPINQHINHKQPANQPQTKPPHITTQTFAYKTYIHAENARNYLHIQKTKPSASVVTNIARFSFNSNPCFHRINQVVPTSFRVNVSSRGGFHFNQELAFKLPASCSLINHPSCGGSGTTFRLLQEAKACYWYAQSGTATANSLHSFTVSLHNADGMQFNSLAPGRFRFNFK